MFTSIVRVLVVAGVILLIPLIAMQFYDNVAWTESDFVVAGTILVITGLIYELLITKIVNNTHRTIFTAVLVLSLFLTWVELAVGIFDW